MITLSRRVAAEGIGTAFLLAGIVGSGIMAERLSNGNVAVALLANTLATGGVLVAIILALGPISGGHFNPAITLAEAFKGGLSWREAPAYICAQLGGAILGVALANTMFAEPVFFASQHARHGLPVLLSEFVATFGLLAIVWGCSRFRSNLTAVAVAAYIVGAYWFTASTSFANPAVAIARSLSDTFSGIAPGDVPGFLAAELLGALAATALFTWLLRDEKGVTAMKPAVLFVCVHNSARSQMAQAFLNSRCSREFVAESAGIEPGELNPLAVAAMREAGVDISRNTTKSISDLLAAGKSYDYVITVCDEANAEKCPAFPGAGKRLHWSLADPSALGGSWEERLAKTRVIRDTIAERVESWCRENCGPALEPISS